LPYQSPFVKLPEKTNIRWPGGTGKLKRLGGLRRPGGRATTWEKKYLQAKPGHSRTRKFPDLAIEGKNWTEMLPFMPEISIV